jgi:hypothetical protein
MPTGDIKTMLHYWEEFQSSATKWHPSKAEMNRLCALVEDKCLNLFKNILKKKEKFKIQVAFSFSLYARHSFPPFSVAAPLHFSHDQHN